MITARVLSFACLSGLIGCGGPLEGAGEAPVETARVPLSVASKGGLAFIRIDGVTATADATSSGLVGLWSGTKPYGTWPILSVQGPDLSRELPGYGTYLTYDWTGAGWAMRGKLVYPAGEPNDGFGDALPTFQDATLIAAIPQASPWRERDVFMYNAAARTAEIWTYGYWSSRFTGARKTVLNAVGAPVTRFSGLGAWTAILGYPRGVLFFDAATNAVWRGFFDPATNFFRFEAAPPIPGGRHYTDVAFVEGLGYLFYNRATGDTELLRYGYEEPGGQVASWGVTHLAPGFDKLVGTGNNRVFLFNSTYGSGTTFWVNAYYPVTQYGFTPDWTTITRVQ